MDVVEAERPTVKSFAWLAGGMAETDATNAAANTENFMVRTPPGCPISALSLRGGDELKLSYKKEKLHFVLDPCLNVMERIPCD
jgi:hypothetical protein